MGRTARRVSSTVEPIGLIGSSPSTDDSSLAAAVAASASTSQRAFETEAAAATSEPKSGKTTAVADCATRLGSSGSTSTTATVTAAHSDAVAEVNGRMAPARAPWLAYVSETAAWRDLTATASTATASANSAFAR